MRVPTSRCGGSLAASPPQSVGDLPSRDIAGKFSYRTSSWKWMPRMIHTALPQQVIPGIARKFGLRFLLQGVLWNSDQAHCSACNFLVHSLSFRDSRPSHCDSCMPVRRHSTHQISDFGLRYFQRSIAFWSQSNLLNYVIFAKSQKGSQSWRDSCRRCWLESESGVFAALISACMPRSDPVVRQSKIRNSKNRGSHWWIWQSFSRVQSCSNKNEKR